VIVEAFAKVNLFLAVRTRDTTGYHPIRSLMQSIGWSDTLSLDWAHEDRFTLGGTAHLAADMDNLAWRAVVAVRDDTVSRRPMALDLIKRIPEAAGLGGGSADAAGGLIASSRLHGVPAGATDRLAPDLGSDVPFCLVGGTAWVEGRGELVTPVPLVAGYTLAVVVPPIELSTPAVYRRWDELGGPTGTGIGDRRLPPSLRDLGPLSNDLLPAATSLYPQLGDWIADLVGRWERPVLLTGSGAGLFGFFVDADEAAEAAASVPGARGAWAGAPETTGWRVVE